MFGPITRLCSLAALLSLATACGLDELGVLSVHIQLDAAGPEELPVGLEDLDPEALHDASGEAEADVHAGLITLDALGLPEPPEGYTYVAMLSFAHGAREGLGDAGAPAEGGHAHGARSAGEGDPAGGHDDGDAMTEVMGALVDVGGGAWSGAFTEADTMGASLGALRSAMVRLAPQEPAPGVESVMVLHGEVELGEDAATEPPAEEAGHSHGA